jgi:predicted AAA+ superfamily ATPase
MIERILSTKLRQSQKSFLLLGPRQIGKTTLLKGLKPDLIINLSREREYFDHLNNLSLLEDLIDRQKPQRVLVDEIQRLPGMLNTIQSIIDENKTKFYLTGSSARKLKRGQANLLPGRILNYRLFPITVEELGYDIAASDALSWGFLPGIISEKSHEDKKEALLSYSSNYIREEIQQEALTRNISGYSKFINTLPELSGKVLDYSKLSAKNKLNRFAVHRFFEIFEDTLLGQRIYGTELVEDWIKVKHPKFYFFDNGVANGIINNFDPFADYLGSQCETIIYNQLSALLTYKGKDFKFEYLRTHSGIEVDFILHLQKEVYGIEVKANDKLSNDDVKSLLQFKKKEPKAKVLLFHFGKNSFKIEGVWCLNWLEGLKEFN